MCERQEIEANHKQADYHTAYTPPYQLFATHFIYNQQSYHSGEHIHDTDQHGREQRVGESCIGEYLGAIIQDCIHAHKLPQNGNCTTHQHRFQYPWLQQGLPLGLDLSGNGLLGLRQTSLCFRFAGINPPHNGQRPWILPFDNEPSGTLGNEENHYQE